MVAEVGAAPGVACWGSGRSERGGGSSGSTAREGAAHARRCHRDSPPGPAHSCRYPGLHTLVAFTCPRDCSPGLPPSPSAHPCACLLPSPGAPRPQAGEWIFPASVNKWWQHAR